MSEYDFDSEAFDAKLALNHPNRVRLPQRVKPFTNLTRCRYLLHPDDELFLMPPTRKQSTNGDEGETSTKRNTDLTTSTSSIESDSAAHAADSTSRVSVSDTMQAMMESLTHGRFALLAQALTENAFVVVSVTAPKRTLYSGRLIAYDRQCNCVLSDVISRPFDAPSDAAPKVHDGNLILFGKRVEQITLDRDRQT